MGNITVDELSIRVREFVESRKWKKYHNPKDIAIALSVEASELLEIFQWKNPEKNLSKEDLDRVRRETADVIIYALSIANACEFDLGKAVVEKIVLNAEKYPVEESKDFFD